MTVPDSTLRATLRDRRRALTCATQRAASEGLWQQLKHWVATQRPGRAAVYAASDGEISLHVVVAHLRECGWTTAYPVVHNNEMRFGLVQTDAELVPGPWGLMEPSASCPRMPLSKADVVFTPLVAFDQARNRIGRGKGFYDRAFAAAQSASDDDHTLLRIGVAHDFQRVDALSPKAHDVALHVVVTPTQVFGTLPG